MFKFRSVGGRLVIILLGFQVGVMALPANAGIEQAARRIEKVRVDIPLKLDEALQKRVIDKLMMMRQQPFVYLDLSINFLSNSKEGVPFTQLIKGKPLKTGADERQSCQFGPLLMGRGVRYELGPIANYNHLLMSVFTGDRADFPYHDVSCEYVSSGEVSRFHVRGIFHIIENSIPTAISLQLRPINPPFEMIEKLFSK